MALQVTAPAQGPANANQLRGTQQDIGDKQIFLKLLVAQMENQDPLNPSDPTQMSAQLAQFNMVEQQTNTNKLLEQLVANQSGGSADSAASYLGKVVTVNQNRVDYSGTPQSFAIDLAGNTMQNYVVVYDPDGVPVNTYALGPLSAGVHQQSWNGLNDTGMQAAPGSYTIEVVSVDQQGTPVPATVQRSGVVDAVRMSPQGLQLMIAGTSASLADVIEVRL